MRQIEVSTRPGALPASEPLDEWAVAAIGPGWAPAAGESELPPVAGGLALHPEGLVFRADDAADRASGEPVMAFVPADEVVDAGPLSPGSQITPTELAGLWMPRIVRRFRSGGFSIRTRAGDWVFDCPHGARRARAVKQRYASG